MWKRFQRAAGRLRTLGPREVARRAAAHAERVAWERYFGVDTSHFVFDVEWHAEHRHYEPLPWPLVRRAVSALAPQAHDVFLDYGAGLGRLMLMAGRQRLERVLGVELMPLLAERARDNLRQAASRLRSPVEVFNTDATTWSVPDDVSLVTFFNPFVGTVMAAVQAQLRASLERRPRPLRLVYAHADDQPDLFASCDWVRFGRRLDVGVFSGMNLALYEHAGPT